LGGYLVVRFPEGGFPVGGFPVPVGRLPRGRLPRVVFFGRCDAYINDGVRGIETVDVLVVRDHLAVNLVVPVAGVPVVVTVVVTVVVIPVAVVVPVPVVPVVNLVTPSEVGVLRGAEPLPKVDLCPDPPLPMRGALQDLVGHLCCV
jgi:hypothetical protein